MIVATSFTATDGGEAVRIVLDVDGEKETYVISVADHFLIGLKKGEVAGDDYLSVKIAADRYNAIRVAIRSITAAQCSAKRLFVKLLQKQIRPCDAEYAVRYVRDRGYIDEKSQIESYLRDMVGRKFMGQHKVVPALLAKGYNSKLIHAVLEEQYTESDFAEAKKAFLEKKFGKASPETREEAEEMKKVLYKQGF